MKRIAITLASTLVSPCALAADGEVAETDGHGSIVSVDLAVDVVSSYFFRGIVQETDGAIVQPGLEIGFQLFEGDGALASLALGAGAWSSIHSGPSGDRKLETLPGSWYEADVYAGISAGLAEGIGLSAIYTLYASPNGTFGAVDELSLALAWDDAGRYGEGSRFGGIQPSFTVAFELDNSAFGPHEGIYGELAVAPNVAIVRDGPLTLTATLPIALGLSLADYFEDEANGDDAFGYVSTGLALGVGLAFVPARYGSWQVSASLSGVFLGERLATANDDESAVVVVSGGLATSF